MRSQLSRLAVVLAAVVADVTFTIVPKGNDIAVSVACATGGATPVSATICDDAGKTRIFKDVDDFIKQAAKLNVINGAQPVTYKFANQTLLEPKLFTGDAVAKNRALVASYVKQVTAATERSTDLATQIANLGSGTPGEIAYKAEKQDQKAAVDALKVWLQAEIVRITALLPVV